LACVEENRSETDMTPQRIYLDYNATAPLLPAARDAMVAAMDLVGNPSSIHAEGRAARHAIETARGAVAELLGVRARDVTFTAGGTEAANLVLTPSLSDGGPPLTRLFISEAEHACVLQGRRFPDAAVSLVPVDADGRIDLAALEAMLAGAAGERVLLALQAANNETGVLQPVAEAAALVHAAGGLVVCDAVQGAGRIELRGLGADAIFISAHKIGGPKGAAALAFANTRLHISDALVRGGGQEKGLRAGTENVAAIAGLGAAAKVALSGREREMGRLQALRDRLEVRVASLVDDVVFFGRGAPRLAQTSAFAAPGASAETLLIALDLAGVAASSGSACSSGKVQPSHVLRAMGVSPDLAKGALRISLGAGTQEGDIDTFCGLLEKSVRNIRSRAVKTAA
jgi:cysteine desulfurase